MISHAYKQNPIMIKDFHFFFSQRWRWVRRLGQTAGAGPPSPNKLHGPLDGVFSGAHHGASGA